MALVMRRGLYREEALSRYARPGSGARPPVMIRRGMITLLWALAVLLASGTGAVAVAVLSGAGSGS